MAVKTQRQIFEIIENSKNADPTLIGLNSPSKTALWRLWAWLTAGAHMLIYTAWEAFRVEISTINKGVAIPTTDWYARIAKEYQHGYVLVLDAYNCVGYTACVSVGRRVLLKIAGDGGTSPVPLSPAVAAGFQSYINNRQPAGVKISIINAPGDYINFTGSTVYYNPSFDLAQVRTAVEKAILSYISTTNFKGEFVINKLIDCLQSLKQQGVEDATIAAQAKVGASPYTQIVRNYLAYAGYLQIDPAYPISNSITYIAL
jgi:hypothetical protein